MNRRTRIAAALTATAAALTIGAQAAGAYQQDDTPPFYGSEMIGSPAGANWQECTSGWMLADYTYKYGMTAGHCGPNGTSFHTAHRSSTSSGLSPTFWGTIQQHTSIYNLASGPQDTDIAPVSSAYAYIWMGSTYTRQVYNWETSNQDVGLSVCLSGAQTALEVCGVNDVAFGQQWYGGNLAVRADCPGMLQCVTPGDSGGTVYTIYTTGAHEDEVEAVGTIVGWGTYPNGRAYATWIPIRYIMQWVWTFNRHTNLLCDICSPEP